MSNNHKLPFCPFHLSIFVITAAVATYYIKISTESNNNNNKADDTTKRDIQQIQSKNTIQTSSSDNDDNIPIIWNVVFIVGGPGVGKGTQCSKYVEYCSSSLTKTDKTKIQWVHISAGELLRNERTKVNSILAKEINDCISSGKLVNSSITCQLIENYMIEQYAQSKITHYLIDGFPRSYSNATVWDTKINSIENNTQQNNSKCIVHFIINCICPEEIAIGRLISRDRSDDQDSKTIRTRLQTYYNDTVPIIQYYETNYQQFIENSTTSASTITTITKEISTESITTKTKQQPSQQPSPPPPNVYTIKTDQNVDNVFLEFLAIFQKHGF